MKKLLAFLMIAALLLGLTACGAKKEEAPAATEAPAVEATEEPTAEPTEPTEEPAEEAGEEAEEAGEASLEASAAEATEEPTAESSEAPTEEPTEAPTEEPTEAPTEEPTEAPAEEPTEAPAEESTEAPAEEPDEDDFDEDIEEYDEAAEDDIEAVGEASEAEIEESTEATEAQAEEAHEAAESLGNPWEETSAEAILEPLGYAFNVPENAEDAIYRVNADAQLAEVQFTLSGTALTGRVKAGDAAEDISGAYYTWEAEEPCVIGASEGTVSMARDGEDTIEVCRWYDVASGLNYSVMAQANDLDGFDITAVAEQLFPPVQGDSDGDAEEAETEDAQAE